MPSLASSAFGENAPAAVSDARSSPLDARPSDTRTRSMGLLATSPLASLTIFVVGVNAAADTARTAAPLATHIRRLAGSVAEERLDRVLQVLGGEQRACQLGHARVRRARAVLLLCLDDALGGGVCHRRAVGERARQLARALLELGVGPDHVHDAPVLQRLCGVQVAGHDELARSGGPSSLCHALRT